VRFNGKFFLKELFYDICTKMKVEMPVEYNSQLKVVHIHNQSKTYHVINQILKTAHIVPIISIEEICNNECDYDQFRADPVEPILSESFFKHILTLNPNEFNRTYSHVGYLIEKSVNEADLYLNVDPDALDHIINYIHSKQIDPVEIYRTNHKTIDAVINLASAFGMHHLVSIMEKVIPTKAQLNSTVMFVKRLYMVIISAIELIISRYGFEDYISKETINTLHAKSDTYFDTPMCEYIENYARKYFHRSKVLTNFIVQIYATCLQDYFFRSWKKNVNVTDDQSDSIVKKEVIKNKEE
jgi:hypothetical protein